MELFMCNLTHLQLSVTNISKQKLIGLVFSDDQNTYTHAQNISQNKTEKKLKIKLKKLAL